MGQRPGTFVLCTEKSDTEREGIINEEAPTGPPFFFFSSPPHPRDPFILGGEVPPALSVLPPGLNALHKIRKL